MSGEQVRAGEQQLPTAFAESPIEGRFRRDLFVSYEDDKGENRERALHAKEIFETAGHSAWVWCCDAKSGAYTHAEISERIQISDRVVYICTVASHVARGQKFERAQALTWEKVIDIVAFNIDDVSGELRHTNARITTLALFDSTCLDLADEISLTPMIDVPTLAAAPTGGNT